jgi:SAM-dependent methyltransferase
LSLPPVEPLGELPVGVWGVLRERCSEAGYSEDLIAEMDGIAPGMFGRDVRPIIQHVLERRGDAASSLARVFGYDDALSEEQAHDALGADLLAAFLDAGLLVRDSANGQAVRSPFQIRPFGGLWLLADDPTGGTDAVMPAAGTTRLVTQNMPAAIDGSVLDVGCGPGSLALTAASRGAREVVGSDVNPRAVDMARLNARLNGFPDTQFVVGDLVEPVAGRRFDLVLSQPPFIVQPPDSPPVTFLHGGPSGEELSLRMLSVLPSVMSDQGRALVLLEAVTKPDEPLHHRMRASVGEAPVDLLVLASQGAPPALQVVAYATLEAPDGGADYQAAVRRYMRHLDRLGARDFQLALVVLRTRPAGDDGRRRLAATVPVASLARGSGAALDRLLKSVDLAALADDVLEHLAVSTSSHARWIEERQRPDGRLEPARYARFIPGSFGSDLELSQERYVMAAMLDEAPTIRDATATYAAACDESPEGVRREVLAFVREGLMRGLFDPRAD